VKLKIVSTAVVLALAAAALAAAAPAQAARAQAAPAALSVRSAATAAATAASLSPNPSVAIDAATDQDVFWKGRGDGLWEAEYNGSWHGPYSLHMGVLLSSPSATFDSHGSGPYVVWEGTNGHLWFTYNTGSGWLGPYDLGMGQFGSAPDITAADDGSLYVFWTTTNGSLYYTHSGTTPGPTGWSPPTSAGAGSLATGPSVTLAGGGISAAWATTSHELEYRAEDGSLHDLGYYLASQPSLIPEEDYRVAFYVGSNGYLYEDEWEYLALTHTMSVLGGGEIEQAAGGAIGGFASAPSAVFLDGTYYVFWQGTDQNQSLWEATCNVVYGPCWAVHDLGMGPV
jgi:hypothetical protein